MIKTVFIRAIDAPVDEKAAVMRQAVQGPHPARFEVAIASFGQVPRSPFAYWSSDTLRSAFAAHPRFDGNGRSAKQGLATADDFRFVRLATEVRPEQRGLPWFPFAKGGGFSRYYADPYLLVDWASDGRQGKAWAGTLYGGSHWSRILKNVDYYFRPGLTWPLRTNGLSFRAMPAGCVFGHKGPAAFVEGDDPRELLALCAVANGPGFGALVAVQLARTELAQSYEVGLIQQTPVPILCQTDIAELAERARQSWSIKRKLDTRMETSHAFLLPALLQVNGKALFDRAQSWEFVAAAAQGELEAIAAEINERTYRLYAIAAADRQQIEQGFGATEEPEENSDEDDGEESGDDAVEANPAPMVASLLSWSLGVAFGRFDVRLATGERAAPAEPEPFDPLPVCSPGMLTGDNGLPLPEPPPNYPLPFPPDGIFVDDPGHPRDLTLAVRSVFDKVFANADANARWHEAAELLDTPDLRTFFARDFFEPHIHRYSKSRRKAPIYWQFATPSSSYSVWIYIHRATSDTLFRVLNDFVAPKLDHEKAKLTALAQQSGPNPSAAQRREIEQQETFVGELQSLKTELARVAPLWKPDLDDGVILNFAPLWRLVPQSRSWQSECRKAWDKLQSGDYDWAHLAMHLWPERVVPKCIDDRSLAIAHGLEEVFWHEDDEGTWRKREVADTTFQKLVRDRTSTTVKAALKDLLAAAAPSAGGGRRAAPRAPAERRTAPTKSLVGEGLGDVAVEEATIAAVLTAIGSIASGASKADVLAATGLADADWNKAIAVLLDRGEVTRTGEKRGARYCAKEAKAT